jgi:hypothetical protein
VNRTANEIEIMKEFFDREMKRVQYFKQRFELRKEEAAKKPQEEEEPEEEKKDVDVRNYNVL